MGGEPYRIMELAPKIGTERASSSVILYVMTHIFSHLCFWLLSVALFVCIKPVNFFFGVLLAAITAFCLAGIWFFESGYRKGLAVRLLSVLRYIPYVKRWARPFVEAHREQLDTIDRQIAALHRSNRRTFFAAVGLELLLPHLLSHGDFLDFARRSAERKLPGLHPNPGLYVAV